MDNFIEQIKENINYIAGFFAAIFVVANVVIGLPSNTKAKNNTNAMLMSPKEAVCGGIGCNGGDRECGTASATIEIGYKAALLEVKVHYTCYENSPSN